MARAKGTAVCFCVLHPLVLQELQSLADGHPFRVLSCKFDSTGLPGHAPPQIPRASVYVVDSPARRQDGEVLVSEIVARYPGARVLVVADRYAEVGAQFVAALETLAAGGFWARRTLLSRFIDETLQGSRRRSLGRADVSLSRREREVLELLLENFSNKEIASRLHISSRTAKFHVSNVLAKYKVKRRADLLLMRLA